MPMILELQPDPYPVAIYICTLPREYKELVGKPLPQSAEAITHFSKKKHRVVIYLNKSMSAQNIGTIAHEASHAIHFVFDFVGIKPSFKNDENEAYYIGWLVTKIIQFLRKA